MNLVPTELYSDEAREAEKQFGIEPRRVFTADQGKQMSTEIFLGVAFTSGLEEVVIPFFDRGLPVEYELTRSIRVVSRSGRKKVGILATDAKMMGGFDMRTFSQNPEWSIVTELKKQYDVSSVSPDAPISGDIDVLLVAQPSSLTQKQIDNLTDYVKKGGADAPVPRPVPVREPVDLARAAQAAAGRPVRRRPAAGAQGEPPAAARPGRHRVALDPRSSGTRTIPIPSSTCPRDRLHRQGERRGRCVQSRPGRQRGAPGDRHDLPRPAPLQDERLRPRVHSAAADQPFGRGPLWNEVAQQSFMGFSGLNPRRRYIPSGEGYTLAARITGPVPADAEPAKAKDADAKKDAEKKKDEKPPAKLNVIAIADLDMIGEQFFQLRRQKVENLDFDNVPFVLNCVDVLAGDESFVGLRKKRLKHRTLIEVEKQANEFKKQLQDETKEAEDEAKNELDEAQQAFNKQVEQVQNRTDLDERTKEIQLANLQDVAQRRLDVKKAIIEDEKEAKVRESKAESERNIRRIQNNVRFKAAALPPLPPLVLGLVVWIVRTRRENLGANPKRLA